MKRIVIVACLISLPAMAQNKKPSWILDNGPAAQRGITLQGGGLAAETLISISCSGEIKVRGVVVEDKTPLAEALREYIQGNSLCKNAVSTKKKE